MKASAPLHLPGLFCFAVRRRYRKILANAREIILLCRRDGSIREYLTAPRRERSLYQLFGPENRWLVSQALQTVRDLPPKGILEVSLTQKTHTGEPLYYRVILQNDLDSRSLQGISLTIEDVSESKRMESRLIQARASAFQEARHDSLTSIPNRLFCAEALDRQFARLNRRPQEDLTLLMIDLDHFKKINDNWGHEVGDRVLIRLSSICSSLVRGNDVFARYGGEEFLCIMEDLAGEDALEAAERMRVSIAACRDWPRDLTLTISIGLAEYAGETDPEDLIRRADSALYRAKSLGRNRVCTSLAT